MDYFSLCYDAFYLAAQGIMHLFFSGRLTGKPVKIRHYAAYTCLLFLLQWFAGVVSLPQLAAVGAEVLILCGANRFFFGNRMPVSWTASILAVYISQLSFGLVNSAEAVLLSYVYDTAPRLLYPLLLAAAAASVAVCIACYTLVLRSVPAAEISQITNAACLLPPALFFFAAELYITQTSYAQAYAGSLSPALLLEAAGKHTALLFLQALGLGALLCTLYAYRQLCRSLRTQAEVQSLTQAVQAQKVYIAEAQKRYARTRAFRHDIKNHLSVLRGLLDRGALDEGKASLQKLESASAALSFPCRTGNPVVDILLEEKLGLAKENGIAAEVSLSLPRPWGIDDFDLCVIFANSLDNAVCACQAAGGVKTIRVSGKQQGDFYLLAFENTCPDKPLPPPGTGLSNLKAVAEKFERGSAYPVRR